MKYPTPWKSVPNPARSDGWFVVLDVPPKPYSGVKQLDGGAIMQFPPAVIPCQLPKDVADMIVRGVNSHDALLAALKDAIPHMVGHSTGHCKGDCDVCKKRDAARAAIALAEKGK